MRRLLALLLLLAAPAAAQVVNTNPYFDTGTTGWVVGSGWTHDGAGKMRHTFGQVGTLSQTGVVPPAPANVNVGVMRNGPGGSLLVALGACSATVYNSVSFPCGGGGGGVSLTITPSADFDGFVDYVTVTGAIGGGAPQLTASSISFGDVGLARSNIGNTLYVTTGTTPPNGVGGAIIVPYTLVSNIYVGMSSQSGAPGIQYGGSNLTITGAAIGPTFVLGVSGTRASIGSGNQFSWSSTTTADGTLDTGIALAGTAHARMSNGGSGQGTLFSVIGVVANTGAAAPSNDTSGALYTNTGDADGSSVTLPNDPALGTVFEACVTVAQALDIIPNSGESIRDGAATGSTKITANTVGATIRLVAVTGGSGAVWVVMSKTGAWTLT